MSNSSSRRDILLSLIRRLIVLRYSYKCLKRKITYSCAEDANWLGVDSEVVTKGLIDFLKQL